MNWIYNWIITKLSKHTPEGKAIIDLLDSSDWSEHVKGYFGKWNSKLVVMSEGIAYMDRTLTLLGGEMTTSISIKIKLSVIDRHVIRKKAKELSDRLDFARRYRLCEELKQLKDTQDDQVYDT